MSLLDQAPEAIRARRGPVLERGVELIGGFGSAARGEDGPNSDVDVAYRWSRRASLLALSRALIDLSGDLGRRIDLVDLDRVDAELKSELERDLVHAGRRASAA